MPPVAFPERGLRQRQEYAYALVCHLPHAFLLRHDKGSGAQLIKQNAFLEKKNGPDEKEQPGGCD
jgi:hypothetical protein